MSKDNDNENIVYRSNMIPSVPTVWPHNIVISILSWWDLGRRMNIVIWDTILVGTYARRICAQRDTGLPDVSFYTTGDPAGERHLYLRHRKSRD